MECSNITFALSDYPTCKCKEEIYIQSQNMHIYYKM